MPLRREITTLDRRAVRARRLAHFGCPECPTVLVTGGSLGARGSTPRSRRACAALSAAGVQVLHVTGPGKEFETSGIARDGVPYGWCPMPTGWTSRMPRPTSSLRAPAPTRSASSPPSGCPRSMCPCPIGNGEQRFNAADVVAAGGGLLVDDADVTAEWCRQRRSLPLLRDSARWPQWPRGRLGGGARW
jgi:UDP-N-acetylglucosamine--N-acetylmuramyl-(pentapeptide) pyrophosphoryl-undecaprenol N-acetylglucosamine transferase